MSVCTDYRYQTGSDALQIELGGQALETRLEQDLAGFLGNRPSPALGAN